MSSSVKSRGVSVPTCSTPSTRPSTSSGTPSRERMPFSRRIGLRMSPWSTSGMMIARRSAAIAAGEARGRAGSRRPARPPPRCPWRRARAAPAPSARAAGTRRCRCRRISVIRSSSSVSRSSSTDERQRGVGDPLERREHALSVAPAAIVWRRVRRRAGASRVRLGPLVGMPSDWRRSGGSASSGATGAGRPRCCSTRATAPARRGRSPRRRAQAAAPAAAKNRPTPRPGRRAAR